MLRKAAQGDSAAAGKERACRADVREQLAESKLHPSRHAVEVGTAMDDVTARTARDHWRDWLGGDAGQAVRREIAAVLRAQLRAQVPSARLDWARVVLEPALLTGGRNVPEDPDTIIVTRAGLAAPCEL